MTVRLANLSKKLTADQRALLINCWLIGEFAQVRNLQKQFGVDHKYTHRLAVKLKLTDDKQAWYNDPRWEWAKERGKVVA